jgi:uncharacterized protein
LTRFPYETKIKKEELEKVEKAEKILKARSYSEIRVRVYGDSVRIEVSPCQVEKLSLPEEKLLISKSFSSLGYKKVEIDPVGYRTGSMDKDVL